MKQPGQEVTRTSTLVDEYIRQLGDLGISLEGLKLLGDFELSEADRKLTEKELIEKILVDENYKEQKEIIQKYITEFIKADLITQEIHRRRGYELVNSSNDSWIDGGVYLFRTKQTYDISGNLEVGDGEVVTTVNDTEYVQMQYVTPDEFDELVKKNDTKIRYRYTLDKDTGELLIAQIKTIETVSGDISNNMGLWFHELEQWLKNKFWLDTDTKIIVEDIIRIDYKAYIQKYTMPYEFLINLCEVTQNPEFVYHVAQLAKETNIMLAVQDDTTVERVTTEQERKYESYENSSSSTSGASKTGESEEKSRDVVITTTMVPVLRVEYADTWSFFEEYEYMKVVAENTTVNGPITEDIPLPAELPDHHPATTVYVPDPYTGVMMPVEIAEKWTGTFLVQTITATQTKTTTVTYMQLSTNSIEKSKQFLGLLRNADGQCCADCESDPKNALKCAQKAVFEKSGTNVEYGIPNATRTEPPLNNLRSGEQMLYTLLGQSLQGDEAADAEEDHISQYKTKMSGLLDHMKYLMTFPANEEINWDDPTGGEVIPDEGDEEEEDDDDDEEEEDEEEEFTYNMVRAAELVHRYVRENGYKYAQASIAVPNYSTKTIDCSSYVTWVVLKAGYRSSRFREGMHQWSSRTFNSNPEGWQTIADISEARPGDILCYDGHVEIYAGTHNGSKPMVYNCGGNDSIKYKETGRSSHKISEITRILRVPI